MNYIRHLNAFYSFVKSDDQLTSSHLSLYMALFQYWNYNRFQNPFPIYRDNLMQLSKIGSKNTYHKCIKDLHLARYIFYHQPLSKFQPVKISIKRLDKDEVVKKYIQLDFFNPSDKAPLHPNSGSSTDQNHPAADDQILSKAGDFGGAKCTQIGTDICPKIGTHTCPNIGTLSCPKFDTDSVPILTATCPIFDTVPVPKMGHNIKHKQINIINEREEKTLAQKIFLKNNFLQQGINKMAGESNSVHGDHDHSKRVEQGPPKFEAVEEFFVHNKYPTAEAKKFFNHYQSNGWLVAGKSPMKDWQSSAHKWMLNASNFKHEEKPVPDKQLQTELKTNKDYGQPL